MKEIYSRASIEQNLMDAGCDKNTISDFIAYIDARKVKEGIALLSRYRVAILDELHKEQRKIDCLDYLIYQIKEHYAESND